MVTVFGFYSTVKGVLCRGCCTQSKVLGRNVPPVSRLKDGGGQGNTQRKQLGLLMRAWSKQQAVTAEGENDGRNLGKTASRDSGQIGWAGTPTRVLLLGRNS